MHGILPSIESITARRRRPALMTSAVLRRPGKFELIRLPVPQPAAGQVRIAVEGCGVCASNLEPWEGKPWFSYPFLPGQPGHEGWGYIDELGDGVTGWRRGDRVAFLSDRSYAAFDVASPDRMCALPPELRGIPFPGEAFGCAANVFARSGIGRGSTVAIVGVGFLGAVLLQMAVNAGARVIAVSRRAAALEAARSWGAEAALALTDAPAVVQSVRKLTDERWCDVVIEATGKEFPLGLAGEITAERGRLVIAGYHQDGARRVNLQLWNWRGLDVINAHERQTEIYLQGMQRAIQEAAAGRIRAAELMTHRFSLAQLNGALEATREKPAGFMKGYVQP